MSVPLSELLRDRTEAEWLAYLTAQLQREGFPLTDAHAGAVGRTLVQIDARALADLALRIPQIAASGFIELAEGPWLDLMAASQYDLEREHAVATEGLVRFATLAGFGPYQLPAPTWIATPNRLLFMTSEQVDVPAGGFVDARVRAEQPGSRYNVGVNTLSTILTPLPGLSATNLAEWILIAGADPERDDRLKLRCRSRWATLGTGATRDAYVSWALDASASVLQVAVLDMDPRGPGTVDVVLAGDGGTVGSDVVELVNTDLQRKRPATCHLEVYGATPRPVEIVGTVIVHAAYLAGAREQVQTNLDALQRRHPIGDLVYRHQIVEQIMTPPGVINVELDDPSADVQLADVEAPLFDTSQLAYRAA